MEHEQHSGSQTSPDRGSDSPLQSLCTMQAAFVWLVLSMGKAIGAIGCIVGPISLASPLWTAATWNWPDALLGITGTAVSVVMFYVFARLKRGFERSVNWER
jgi:hypothetical protein